MNERLVVMNIDAGEVGVTLGANFHYFTTPCDLTVIFVCATPSVDDAGLTLDINDDGTGVIAALSCADADAPGTWKSKHMGGTNDPVTIAAGSKVSLDANNAAADTVLHVQIWALTGEVFA
jgi:hypothetical protein